MGRIRKLVAIRQPGDCANYLKSCSYKSDKPNAFYPEFILPRCARGGRSCA